MSDDPAMAKPSWRSAVLVCKDCKDCKKRRNGPGKLKPKAVAAMMKHAARKSAQRPRVMMTSCPGICPEQAMALGLLGASGDTCVAIVKSISQVERVMPLLTTLGGIAPAGCRRKC